MKVPAGEFKAKCLKLMDSVSRTREPIIITKRGQPVAKLVPPDEPESRRPIFGYMAGTAEIRGDIGQSPQVDWSAETGDEDQFYARLGPSSSGSRNRPPAAKRRHK